MFVAEIATATTLVSEELTVTPTFVIAVSASYNETTPVRLVVASSRKVRFVAPDMIGASTTELTVSKKVFVSLPPAASVTTRLISVVPNALVNAVTPTVRLEEVPVNVNPFVGTRLALVEVAVMVNAVSA